MTARGARFWARTLLFAGVALSLAGGASALPLTLDPLQSSLTQGGSSQAVSGSLEIALTTPVVSNTAFDVVSLSLSPLAVALDPAAPNPGAGVVNAAGSFLIPTLFIAFDDGNGVQTLGLPNVSGTMQFDASGALIGLQTSIQVDPGGGAPLLLFSLVAVPEPASTLLLFAAAAALVRRIR